MLFFSIVLEPPFGLLNGAGRCRERHTKRSSSILPALAFSLDMFSKTESSYGVNEVLLASVLGAVVFSLFAGQPLVIVGVTGNRDSEGMLLAVTLSHQNYRAHHGLQLYRFRYHHPARDKLLCFHVLDCNV